MDAAAAPPARDWSLLPLDALASVFARLNAVYVLTGAGQVCRSWRDAAMVPDVWRVVEMDSQAMVPDVWRIVEMDSHKIKVKENFHKWPGMAKAAVDRSGGQLRVFAGTLFVTKEFLQYLVQRSPSLTILRLGSLFPTYPNARIAGGLQESPLRELRSLELEEVPIDMEELTGVLENCPALEHLTVRDCFGMHKEDEHVLREKFARIKTLAFECCHDDFDGQSVDFEVDIQSVDFEDDDESVDVEDDMADFDCDSYDRCLA